MTVTRPHLSRPEVEGEALGNKLRAEILLNLAQSASSRLAPPNGSVDSNA
eukprot:CAMPEP_0119409574 /NCGR_PEP_ID=MMETSP1335-20130426/2832_1 /TAXON_ID=259385 /ORGANISM="Chrysoculter rhomboideus, Strain RCC1486" /LENGTH=49 /DNA_ID=CAMNT_0007433971 /DNA_START=179 /DNA_END=328 /DNA_ORIENTATION=-